MYKFILIGEDLNFYKYINKYDNNKKNINNIKSIKYAFIKQTWYFW